MNGLANQVKNNPTLLQFKLLYYRLNSQAWRILGAGLGKSK
jgi:hypothetical protein